MNSIKLNFILFSQTCVKLWWWIWRLPFPLSCKEGFLLPTYLLHNFICSSLVAVNISCEISHAFLTSAGRFEEKKCSMAGVDASRLTPFFTSWLARFFLARESSRPDIRQSVTSSDVIGPSSSVGVWRFYRLVYDYNAYCILIKASNN